MSLSQEERAAAEAEILALSSKNEMLNLKISEREKMLRTLKEKAIKVQVAAECEEEKIGNALLRRVSSLKREKAKLEKRRRASSGAKAVVLNQIALVRKAKAEIENRIEAEQELQMNQLHKELCRVSQDKLAMEHRLHRERADFLLTLQKEVDRLRQGAPAGRNSQTATPIQRPRSGTATPIQNESQGSNAEFSTLPNTEAEILNLESVLCDLVEETANASTQNDSLAQENERLLQELKDLQRDSFLEKAKAIKMREELEAVSRQLNVERQLELPPAANRPSHRRSDSSSSEESAVESVSSRSSYSVNSSHSASINLLMASRDKNQIRAHTKEVLSGRNLVRPGAASERSRSASELSFDERGDKRRSSLSGVGGTSVAARSEPKDRGGN